MAEFVGGFIDEKVIAQLSKRSIIYSKKDKTVDDIHFMNSRNAWVRIVSSVNLLDEQGNYTSKPAQNFILSNLVSLKENFKEVTEEGKKVNKLDSLSPVLSSGIDFSGRDASKAYNYSSALGVRPRPGITSFSVISKGRFGTIREANVAFSVWSVEDLDAIERLYFAPGYTCIVEWGHTVYVDNNGQVQTDTSEANKSLLDYFNDSKSQQDIAAILKDKTEKTNYNYESFFGIIKNFSWSFRPDGGYDCSVSIISQGEVLQSLSMNVDNAGTTSQAVVQESSEDSKKQETDLYNKNLIYRFLGDIRRSGLSLKNLNRMSPKVRDALDINVTSGSAISNLTPYRTESSFYKVGNSSLNGKYIAFERSDTSVDGSKYYYFTLRTLLQLINKGFIIKDENCKEIAGFDIQSDEQFFSFDKQISLDPRICMLPKEITVTGILNDGTKDEKVLDLTEFIELPKVISYQSSIYNKRILDILITDLLVQRGLESAGDNVANFVNFILSEISSALGNINEFVIYEDPDSFGLKIKDVGVTPSKSTYAKQVEPIISLTGLRSILTDLNIQSKVSKDLVAMISIAAQSGPTSTGEDAISMTRWNEGRVDRFLGEKTQDGCFENRQGSEPKEPQPGFFKKVGIGLSLLWTKLFESDEPVKKDTFYQLLYRGYTAIIPGRNSQGQYLGNIFAALKTKGTSLFQLLVYGTSPGQIKDKEELTISKGVIPVELSFKTDGIGGLKIGQAFKVSGGALPTRYDEFGYIITGIDHVIENNRWYTNVKSQLFIIKDRDLEGNNFIVQDLNLGERLAAGGAALQEDYATRYIAAVPWSAGFISFVARQISNFPRNGAHVGYAQAIRRGITGWTVLDPATSSPIPGDIIISNRDGNTMSFQTSVWTGFSHGDIVISNDNRSQITAIGGNLGSPGTVKRYNIPGVTSGKLPTTGNNSFFVIIRPPANDGRTLVNNATTEYTKWEKGNWNEKTKEAYNTLYQYYVVGGLYGGGLPNLPDPLPTP